MTSNNTFVFAVCGPAEEIETLNFSLGYLRRFTNYPIRVVTDLARNEARIDHDEIIDYRTPSDLTHRQAALTLKTGLHRILPASGIYCYLDSDVIAVNEGVNNVFAHKQRSSTFATEWTRLSEFSGYAIRCGCLLKRKAELARLEEERSLLVKKRARILEKWIALQRLIGTFDNCAPELETDRVRLRDAVRNYWMGWNKAQDAGICWRDYVSSHGGNIAQVVEALGYHWDESQHVGYDAGGRLIWAEDPVRLVEGITGCTFDVATQRWTDIDGQILDTALVDTKALDEKMSRIYSTGCEHLRQAIRSRFGVDVKEPNWRHWNSGVFLFDHEDVELLDLWHRWSIETFSTSEWETRDQGTLIAAVWKLGLERQGNLPIEFNFLADYYRTDLYFDPDKGFSFGETETYYQPSLIHVYHHFGDRSWPVWKWIELIGTGN